ncbi:hydrolase [Rhodococcus sp. ABRD24]|uniref:zinc-dependent metalloprotease n=1 Tax=Rhodococcus sp. ABRD24 TaxID=2507582 RepID=UPI0010391B4F|nr:zinc-dependent metalloprotease [Rhodococcus sp. ABRD24]QBJ97045.1 hydrolase [Rhodococcus sp. ABRD24]
MSKPEPESGFAGAVDWGLAARTGARLAPGGPSTSRYTAEAVVTELADAAVRAEGPVREVTGLLDGLPVPPAQILDRAGWIRAAAHSMAQLTGSDVDAAQPKLLAGKPGGVQAGAMLAFLSSAILGQYDPFTGPHGTLLLVAPNVLSVERTLGVRPSDFRLWVCLHEVTHRVQFSSAPWIADYMRQSVATLGESSDEPLTEFVARLSGALRERGRGDELPAGQRGVVGLLRATQAEPQRQALDRMLMLGTVLEGHADHVMDAVGPSVVPSVASIRTAFDARRGRRTNPVQRVVRALLGMDAKIAQYVRGKIFVDAVVGRVGMEQFNAIWSEPDALPTTTEIDVPEAWIARVLG